MDSLNTKQIVPNTGTAALPGARRALAMRGKPGMIVCRLASLYDWVSGPPVTAQERQRAALADVKNSRFIGKFFA